MQSPSSEMPPASLWLQKYQQWGWWRKMVGSVCSGPWQLTNKSRMGLFMRRALKRQWLKCNVQTNCSNGQDEKNNVILNIKVCKKFVGDSLKSCIVRDLFIYRWSLVPNAITLTLCVEPPCKVALYVPMWLAEAVQPLATIRAKFQQYQ